MIRNRKMVIFLGAVMILAGLLWMVEPYYTWAQEDGHPCRVELEPEEPLFELENMNPGDTYEESITVTKVGSAPAELFFAWEYIDAEPGLDEEGNFKSGNLFDQLEMTIVSEGVEVFSGKMSDWQYDSDNPSIDDTINLTEVLDLGVIEQDDEVVLDFKIHLPGPETGNEFQESSLVTRLVFFTICTGNGGNGSNGDDDNGTNDDDDNGTNGDDDNGTNGEDEEVEEEEETVVISPEPEVDPGPSPEEEEEKQEEEEETVTIVTPESPRVDPPLPRTDGVSVGLLAAGLLFLMAGLSLKKSRVVR